MIRAVRLLNLRRIVRQPLRSVLAVAAVAAGVALPVCIIVLVHSINLSLKDLGSGLAGPTQIRVVGPLNRASVDARVPEQIERVDGVAAVVPLVQAVTIGHPAKGADVYMVALGADCRLEKLLGSFGCNPEAFAGSRDSDPPIVSTRLYRRLGADGVIRTNMGQLSVAKELATPRLDALNRGDIAIFPLRQAQNVFVRGERFDVVYVQADKGVNLEALRGRLRKAVGPWNHVLLSTDPPPGSDFASGPLLPLFSLLAFFAVGISVVVVGNIASLTLEERRKDLAVTQALGGTTRVTTGGALIEATALGLAGGWFGAVVGSALAQPVANSVANILEKEAGAGIEVRVPVFALVFGIVLGAVVAVIGAWRPARKTARIDVAAELTQRDRRTETAPRASLTRALGYGLLAAGSLLGMRRLAEGGGLDPLQATISQLLVVVATITAFLAVGAWAPILIRGAQHLVGKLGAPVRLGVDSLVREPRRTAAMAGAVGAAVGIACGLANVVQSIDAAAIESFSASAEGRVWVSTLEPNNSQAIDARTPRRVIEALEATPSVRRVERTGYALSFLEGDKAFVAVHGTVQPSKPYRMLRGPSAKKATAGGRVLVGPTLARLENLHTGSRLRVATPTGFATMTVGGVWADPDFNGSAITIPHATLERLFGAQPPQELYLEPDGVSPEALRDELVDARLDPFLQVKTAREVGEAIAVDIRKQLAPFWALQRAMMVVAFVATLSTLLLVGVQRRRELGLLAAVGMAPGGLAGMALMEAAMVAIAGSLLGAVAGAATDEAIRQAAPILFGLRPPFRFDLLAPVLYAVLAVGVVSVAAMLPAIRTARMPVLEAIRYE